jgi:hypothetical protein
MAALIKTGHEDNDNGNLPHLATVSSALLTVKIKRFSK